MAKIAERLKTALKIRDISQSELSRKTGIGKSSISTYLTGEYEPKQKNIYKMALALNVNEAWLMGAEVPMEQQETATSHIQNPIAANISPLPATKEWPVPGATAIPADKSSMMAAFWGGEKDLSQEELDAMWNDVERFAAFLAEKKRQEKQND